MVGILTLPRTTIGKKVIMALTGLIWIGYLVMHMYGNLKIFNGAVYFNEYAHGLREMGAPIFGHGHLLWIARIIFIVSFLSHVWAAITLNRRNKESRNQKYAQHRKLKASPANLTMIWGGIAILLFVIYHLMHFTLGILVHPSFSQTDAYHNVVAGFQSYGGLPVIIYLIALIAVGFHLYHGIWSVFQTLGLNNKTYSSMLRMVAIVTSVIISVGYATVPIAVLLGYVEL